MTSTIDSEFSPTRPLCPTKLCPGSLDDDGVCQECGAVLAPSISPAPQFEFDRDVNLEERVLCSDGGCMGILGVDGRCKECGLLGDVDSSQAATSSTTDLVDDDADWDDDADDGDRFEDRRLCPDGACMGVIDAKGHCPMCGIVAS